MKSFASKTSGNGWVLPVTTLSLVLGFMLVTASITKANRTTRFQLLGTDQRARFNTDTDIQEKYSELSAEVGKLREENSKLQKAVGDNSKSANVLNESLVESKAFAALTDMQGPGIRITLTDSKPKSTGFGAPTDNIIHDVDILKVTNELFASGAEAVDVNGQRVSSTTWFRCAGPTIYFDNVRIASPFVIRAIGDPATLLGGMKLPGGILDEIAQTDPSMVMIEQAKDMKMIAYAGSTARKFGRIPVEAK